MAFKRYVRFGLGGCFVAAACSTAPNPSESSVVEATPSPTKQVVGRYRFRVDPHSSEPLKLLTAETLAERGEVGVSRQPIVESVLSSVDLFGPGTWDPGTQRLTGNVRITNTSGAIVLDEPELQIVSTTASSPNLLFEGVDSGSGGPGSVYGYADMDLAAGVNNGSAYRTIVIYDPDVESFDFTVDVMAETGTAQEDIYPDADDDSYNIEAGEYAGDDCDDNDATKTPVSGTCVCNTPCDFCGYGCCEEQCTGDCDAGEAITCLSACNCDIDGDTDGNVEVDCASGSTCDVACQSGAPGADSCDVDCLGGNCTVTCSDNDGDDDCALGCTAGSTCDLDCQGALDCTIDFCTNGSDCDLSCDSTADDCSITSCTGGSTCDVDCTSTGTCNIGLCGGGGSSCSVTCSSGQSGAGCGATCAASASCLLYCNGATASCDETNLTCLGNAPPEGVACPGFTDPNDVYACDIDDCPCSAPAAPTVTTACSTSYDRRPILEFTAMPADIYYEIWRVGDASPIATVSDDGRNHFRPTTAISAGATLPGESVELFVRACRDAPANCCTDSGTVTVNLVADCATPATPTSSNLVISEYMINGDGTPCPGGNCEAGESVELTNLSHCPIDLNGFHFMYWSGGGGYRWIEFDATDVIPPRGTFLLMNSCSASSCGYDFACDGSDNDSGLFGNYLTAKQVSSDTPTNVGWFSNSTTNTDRRLLIGDTTIDPMNPAVDPTPIVEVVPYAQPAECSTQAIPDAACGDITAGSTPSTVFSSNGLGVAWQPCDEVAGPVPACN